MFEGLPKKCSTFVSPKMLLTKSSLCILCILWRPIAISNKMILSLKTKKFHILGFFRQNNVKNVFILKVNKSKIFEFSKKTWFSRKYAENRHFKTLESPPNIYLNRVKFSSLYLLPVPNDFHFKKFTLFFGKPCICLSRSW